MVKESNSKIYTSRLPAPSMYGVTAGSSPAYKSSKMTRSDNRIPREEQVQEILELKKALAKTRQDLQKTRSRRQSQDARSSSDEVTLVFCLFDNIHHTALFRDILVMCHIVLSSLM